MASVQARHSRTCALGKPWTPFTKERLAGCSCQPSFFIVIREGRKSHRERVGKDRQSAERALRKIGTQVDEGVYQPQKAIRFSAWAERYLDGLEREATTVRSYRSTMTYAKQAFADKVVRRLTTEDVLRFNAVMRQAGASASTRAKHLRVLIACLNSAIAHGYASRNPARELPKGERPRIHRKEAAFFENDELPRLFAEIPPTVYRVLS